MSSEDDDDEELLQRALAQQVQRDEAQLKRRPFAATSSGSGVLVTPPQQRFASPVVTTPTASLLGPPRRTPPRTPPTRAPPILNPNPVHAPDMDEDDEEEESDVELLSISSDDDDKPGPTLNRDLAKREVPKRLLVEDDSGFESDEDGQEPANWINVNQAELVRRVRDMREARGTSVGIPLSLVTRIRKIAVTTVIDARRSEDSFDPLGLGFINPKSLSLVRDKRNAYDSGEAVRNECPAGEEEGSPVVRDSSLREKVMYHSENFEPKFFLARIHRNTSSSDLEAGESALKTDFHNCKDQLKKLVKENFDCFVSCKNTIDDIHSKLQQIEADPEGAGTVHLSNCIRGVDVVAKRAFGPLLERQAQAERIRSVQGMLQRFRTLFNLPSIIRESISKGEFDLAIREYKKAKSLVQYTHVGILSRVLEEVDKIVQEFKDTLYKTMENPAVNNSQLETTIRLLLELEPDSDPVWYYLSIQDRRIRGLLEGCSLEHEARMDALVGRLQERVQSDARWKQLQRESNKASDVDLSILLGEHDKELGDGDLKESSGEDSDALLVLLIRRLTVIFVQYVPKFWRLALSIFNGKFVKLSQSGPCHGRPAVTLTTEVGIRSCESQPALQQCRHSMDEVVTMVLTIVSVYESKVLNAFSALADAKVLRPFMRKALMEVSKASIALQGKDCAPISAVQALLVLRLDITKICVLRLCTLIRGLSSEFALEEEWVPVSTRDRGGTPYAISYLPLRFRTILVAALEQMTIMIQSVSSEAVELPEQKAPVVYEMQEHVRNTFVECFIDFAEYLDKLATDLSESLPLQDSPGEDMGECNTVKDEFTGLIPGSEVNSPHQRLLIVLSNTAFCKNSLLPTLLQRYETLWIYAGSERTSKRKAPERIHIPTIDEANATLSSLEKKILDQYNFAKATNVGVAAAAYLINDGSQWGQTSTVQGIRNNLVELIHPLVTVHAEVYSGAKPFLDKVIKALVEALVVALLNVFTENKDKFLRLLDVNGYCQLMLELDFIDAVLERYFTSASQEAAIGLRDMLLEKVCESVREIHQSELVGPSSMRSSRGNEDTLSFDRSGPMSPDEIQACAHQISAEYLPTELRRTRTNVVCFTDSGTDFSQAGRRVVNMPTSISGRHLVPPGGSTFHNLWKSSGILGGDPDTNRSGARLLPVSPNADYSEPRRGSQRTLSARSYDIEYL